jgi:hypothetical protein
LSHVDILVQNLLGDEVNVPETESIVVDGDELIVGVVEEFDLVSDVHSNVVSDKGFTGLDVPDNELVIILATERSHVALVR